MRTVILVMVLVMVLAPMTSALAQTGGTSGGRVICLPNPLDPGADCNAESSVNFASLLDRILTYLLQLGAIIGAIMIIIGAYQILFAGGDPEKFATGKRTVLYTAIAYAILLMAKGIVNIIENFLTGN